VKRRALLEHGADRLHNVGGQNGNTDDSLTAQYFEQRSFVENRDFQFMRLVEL
jgi:hypothetical protein